MTFSEAEHFLLSLANMPRKEYMTNPKACVLYLNRMQYLLDLLDNPEKRIHSVIHIAGTSGKGSVATFLHGMLCAVGLRTGLTISPHPTNITERWRVGNKDMTKKEFVEMIAILKTALDRYIQTGPYDMPSYFEITMAMAFLYFAHKRVAWAVVETGCGGRYDASNVIPPEHKKIAVITTIGLDHTEILGDTKEKIAYEKAGIIVPGCRAYTMEKNPNILEIIRKECKKNHVLLHQTSTNIKNIETAIGGTRFVYREKLYTLSSIGSHQAKNAALAIDVAESIGIDTHAIRLGLQNAVQPLRMEVVHTQPIIILDGAHNQDKIKSTVRTVSDLLRSKHADQTRVHLLVGFSDNKQWKKLMRQLAALRPKTIHCTRYTNNPFRTAADPARIAAVARQYSPDALITMSLDPAIALTQAKKTLRKHDILLITGSIFLSGELRPGLTKTK